MPFVVDNSVVSGWYLARQATPYTDAVLDQLRIDTAIVPPLWELELVNVARTAMKRSILTDDEARLATSFILSLPITVDRSIVPPERVLSLAITYDLTAYDAAYLELSLRLKLPIAAKDGALRGAAEKAGVSLVQD
ncbi:MAG: type II toxin-antitoxin system VapC family toxin [Sulfuritalea sp.]|nr:type II toxin-antitoxin system VapC family toxin [Sulfuritalea sp.]